MQIDSESWDGPTTAGCSWRIRSPGFKSLFASKYLEKSLKKLEIKKLIPTGEKKLVGRTWIFFHL